MNSTETKTEFKKKAKCEIYNDSMQNWKKYNPQKAQLIIADVPYNVGTNFYGSNPTWYIGGDNKNGESEKAARAAFYSDFNFNLYEFFHFGSQLLKKEPTRGGERGKSSDAPCMIVFCSFQQLSTMIDAAAKHGFIHYIPLVFCKNSSGQALKVNMRIVGATEYALLFYKSYLPKFRNGTKADGKGNMVLNWFEDNSGEEWGASLWMMWGKDGADIPKVHPTQKPVNLLKRLIELFTDEGDVVIDPCAGSGSTGRACIELGRSFYGFEISKEFYNKAKEQMLNTSYSPKEKQIDGQITLEDIFNTGKE